MLTYIYAYISCSLTFNELFVLSSLSYCCPTCPVGRAAQGNTAVFFLVLFWETHTVEWNGESCLSITSSICLLYQDQNGTLHPVLWHHVAH